MEKISGTDNEYGIKTGYWNPTWTNRCTIKITPDEGINGNLDVYSTLPENKTIRYIDFDVTNAEGITRKVTVAQYPLEYITNIQGWYSYSPFHLEIFEVARAIPVILSPGYS